MTTAHTGSCHCGALSVEFHTGKPLAPRACDCSFCRKHGARSVSDSEGKAIVRGAPLRYQFGTKTADFLICSNCGIYVGALIDVGGACYSVLNLNVFDDPRRDLADKPMSYGGESVEERAERRRRVWTPTALLAS